MKVFAKSRNNALRLFIENLRTLDELYNEPMELMLDEDNIYYGLSVH